MTQTASVSGPARSDFALYLGFGAMVVGQFMAVLDIQIVASSLQQIQAGIGATADEVSWIQTAYIIPEVVMIPLSAYLSRLWGTRNVFVVSCAGFTIASVLTGLSTSIEMMIFTRALQGFVGGAMIPTVFATAFTAFPGERRILASTIIGMVVTMAPTIGPSLGGWITENLDWRWLFFVNVAPGIAVMVCVWRYANFDKGDPSLAKGFDWIGLCSMAAMLMSLQYVLEEGTSDRWFDSEVIVQMSTLAFFAGLIFIWRTSTYFNPIIDFRAFQNRNFLVGILFTFVMGVNMFGGSYLLPLFLGQVGGMSAGAIGATMGISGLSLFLAGPICGRLVRVVDHRMLMVGGMIISSGGLWLAHALTPEWGFTEFAVMQIIRGFGLMCAMVASQQLTMASMPPELVKNASGLLNLSRNVGGAMGLATLSSIVGQGTREHIGEMSARMAASDPMSASMLMGLVQRMTEMGVADPEGAARKAMTFIIQKQSMTLAFGEAFAALAILTFIVGFIALFVKGIPRTGTAQSAIPVEQH